MASDLMRSTKAVRREDLFQDAAVRDGKAAHNKDGQDEEAAAARAELDAYMESMLGLQAYIPAPRPKSKSESKPESTPTPNKRSKDDNNSDVDMDSSDDEETEKAETQPEPAKPTATEFTFRLFSGSGKAAVAAATASDAAAAPQPAAPIVLLDDINGDASLLGPGALMGPPRPLSHYLVGPLSDEARERYAQTAISGDDIIAQASPAVRNTWGLEVPWRARTIVKADKAALRALLANTLAPGQPAPNNLPAALAAAINSLPAWANGSPPSGLPSDEPGPRKRPGKRQRIILRRREKARREKEAAAALLAQSKEEQISEKKKRLNRLKKLRRREKAKSAKAGGTEDGIADSGDDSGGD